MANADTRAKPAETVVRRVSVFIHMPRIPAEGNRKLWEVLGWNDPERLLGPFIIDVFEASHGALWYEIAELHEIDGWPALSDGFAYDAERYMACWKRKTGWHKPEGVDYPRLIREFDLRWKIDTRFTDEAWFLGFPYGGFYESIMAGRGAFWCNAPPLKGTESISRRFVIMAFNYERSVGEMLESMGHRAESVMRQVYSRRGGEENLWERFTRHEKTHPGRSEVGTVHFAPNSTRDYDWGNPRRVLSRCDDWYDFPRLTGRSKLVDCREWGGGDIRLHHLWWFRHMPHWQGEAGGISANWWEYIADPNRVEP
jgi:hypothetical protein